MHSRSEAIRQVLAGMEPETESDTPVSFSGSVAQVNIISHATINIGSVQIVADGELLSLEDYLRPKGRKRKGRKGKATRSRPWPERP